MRAPRKFLSILTLFLKIFPVQHRLLHGFLPFPRTYINLGDPNGLGTLLVTVSLFLPPMWAYSGGGASAVSSPSKLNDWNLCCAPLIRTLYSGLLPIMADSPWSGGTSSRAFSV